MKSYANAVKTMQTPLLPEQLTLHELLLTIRNAGQLLRKLDKDEQATFGCDIRSLINNIVEECNVLHPENKLCFAMHIIVPPLWYWARADTDIILSKPFFHNIFTQEGLLLRSFLKSKPLVIQECLSHNNLLQLFDKYYKSRRSDLDKNKIYYIIPEEIQQWRFEKDSWRYYDNTNFAQKWLEAHNHELVQIPEFPSIWKNKDPILRPVIFEVAINTQDNALLQRNSTNATPSLLANNSKSNSWADECDISPPVRDTLTDFKGTYESSVTLLWKDNIRNTHTNVVIARNKQTGKLEIFEQAYNPLLCCIYEIIVPASQ
jgi:hypothetical protein